jgi:hypothetical protein
VLVFEGAYGSGKTALINWLAKQLDQRVPYARLDFATNQNATVPEVLSALAVELSRHCAQYPQLKFPRLEIGLVVVNATLDLRNYNKAIEQLRGTLDDLHHANPLSGILKHVASGVVVIVQQKTDLPLETLIGDLDDVADGAGRWRFRRRFALGPVLSWFGHRGRGYPNDPINELFELNRWANSGDDGKQQVTELLLDAFLADLRAEASNSRLTTNTVVLLDNADTELGQEFLDQLVSAHRLRAAAHHLDPEPLTVVTTSRGPLLANAPPDDVFESDGDAEVAEEFLDRKGGHRPHWFRYPLPDLTKDEVLAMVAAQSLRTGDKHQLTALIRQVTGGHPAGTRLFLDAIAQEQDHWNEPAMVLTQPEPRNRADGLLVAERMLANLLGDFQPVLTTDLITCASAATPAHAVRLATSGCRLPDGTPLLARGEATYLKVVHPVLWSSTGVAGTALLRTLLLGRLAQRGTDVEHRSTHRRPEWCEVFGWHRDRCAEEQDQVHELYYALAAGDLGFVAPILLRRLKEDPAEEWHQLLRTVVKAPYRPHHISAPRDTPADEMLTLTGDITDPPSPLDTMRQLVAGLQLLGSPLTGVRRSIVHMSVSIDYAELARLSPRGRELLFTESIAHTEKAKKWR